MTPTVYSDRATLRVTYQVKSSSGLTKINRSGMSVRMEVYGSTITCSTNLNSNTGVPNTDCFYTFGAEAFSTEASQTSEVSLTMCYYNSDCVSDSASITRAQKVEWNELSSLGMIGILSTAPQYNQDTVTLAIYANTGGNALNLWWPKVTFDNSGIQYSGLSVGSLWNTPTKLLASDNEINAMGILEVPYIF